MTFGAGSECSQPDEPSVNLDARLRNQLTWALDFVHREVQCLEEYYRDGNGDMTDDDVSAELVDARRWIKETQELLA